MPSSTVISSVGAAVLFAAGGAVGAMVGSSADAADAAETANAPEWFEVDVGDGERLLVDDQLNARSQSDPDARVACAMVGGDQASTDDSAGSGGTGASAGTTSATSARSSTTTTTGQRSSSSEGSGHTNVTTNTDVAVNVTNDSVGGADDGAGDGGSDGTGADNGSLGLGLGVDLEGDDLDVRLDDDKLVDLHLDTAAGATDVEVDDGVHVDLGGLLGLLSD